ncbi:hypothetical protein [Blastococcus sp. KM273128]|nr:hypothetical protein [Blastococcus sp. KM273128]
MLFHEFLGEEYPDGTGARHEVRVDIHEIGQLDNRPWPEQPGED